MKRPDSRVRAKASCSSGTRGAYCALTSTWGIGICAPDRSRLTQTDDQSDEPQHDQQHGEVLDVAEVVMEPVPARAEPPADPGEAGAPDRVPDQRERVVAPERALEDPGGDRDERPRDGRHAADEHRP